MKTKAFIIGLMAMSFATVYGRGDTLPPAGGSDCFKLGRNVIKNGDFESGNVAFSSGYTYDPNCINNANGLSKPGFYHVVKMNTCYFPRTDRQGGNGNVIHFPDIDGSLNGKVFWQQVANVSIGKTYYLTFWVYEPSSNCTHQQEGTRFDVYINGMPLMQNDNVGGCDTWTKKVYSWVANSANANVEIRNGLNNYNNGAAGMDLFIDDISMQDCMPPPCDNNGKELIVNGEFTSGNTGFTSAYTYQSGCGNGVNGNGTQGKYHVVQMHTQCYAGYYDYLGNTGWAMHVPDIDGALAGKVIWAQSVNVFFNKTYNLSFWVYEPDPNCTHQAIGTKFEVYINGVLVQQDDVGNCSSWNYKNISWTANSSVANIEIRNGSGNFNLGTTGMDLFLDAISMKECLPAPPCDITATEPELILNGDFTSGNAQFNSGYNYQPNCAIGLTAGMEVYGNGTNGNYHVVQIQSCYGILDRSGANGDVIHFPDIDNANPGQIFWEQNVSGLTIGNTYNLSLWVYEPVRNCGPQPGGTKFDVYINGLQIAGDQVGGCSSWSQKWYSWTASVPNAQIEIRNASGNYMLGSYGMDLIMDGISFKRCSGQEEGGGEDEDDGEDGEGRKIATGVKKASDLRNDVSIMPNPGVGGTVLKSSADMEVRIINELGQVVRTLTLNSMNNHTVSVENLAAGLYFVTTVSNDHVTSKKLLITK